MVQTGVPFGEIESVRGWLGICETVQVPAKTHPQRPILGFDCPRCEVSGKRLWGLFASRFHSPAEFFKDHFVANYCPLAFLEEGGRNRTPDKLPAAEREALYEVCDTHLLAAVAALKPECVVGIGDFAACRAREALSPNGPKVVRILHPSPASPAANKDWAGTVTRQLQEAGIW
jgi:single-strand selective monofunctional uracil DNA glycosylase